MSAKEMRMRKPIQKRLVPATKEKACTVCGVRYVYPTKGSAATRHKCDVCVQLPDAVSKTMKRLNDRLRQLESKLKKLEASKPEKP